MTSTKKKTILRTFFIWFKRIVLSVLLLIFILLAVLFSSAFQTYFARRFTAKLSQQTHKKISIDKFHISPYGELNIENLFVEGGFGDTLVDLQKLSVNVDLLRFFLSETLDVEGVTVSNADVFIQQNSDSLYNFNYLTDFFETSGESDNNNNTSFDFLNLNNTKLNLNNVNFRLILNDFLKLDITSNKLALNTGTIDISANKYFAEDIKIDGTKVKLVINNNNTNSNDDDNSEIDIKLGGKLLEMSDILFELKMPDDSIYLKNYVAYAKILPDKIDLQNQYISANTIEISGSDNIVQLQNTTNAVSDSLSFDNQYFIVPETGWAFQLTDKLSIKKSSIKFDDNSQKKYQNIFNPFHFYLHDVDIELSNSEMNDNEIKGFVKQLAFSSGKFKMQKFRVFANLSNKELSLSKMFVQTSKSVISGSVKSYFSSVNQLFDNYKTDSVSIDLKSKINISDVNYFVDADSLGIKKLAGEDFSARLYAKSVANRLVIDTLKLKILQNTSCFIRGLVENHTKTDSLDASIFLTSLKTTKNDIEKLTATDSLKMPDLIAVSGYAGIKNDSLNSTFKLISDAGSSDINFDYSFSNKFWFVAFQSNDNDLHFLLPEEYKISGLNMNMTAEGKGFDSLPGMLNCNLDSLIFDKTKYKNISFNLHKTDNQDYAYSVKSNNPELVFNSSGTVNYADSIFYLTSNFDVQNINWKKFKLVQKNYKTKFNTSVKLIYSEKADSLSLNLDLQDFMATYDNKFSNMRYAQLQFAFSNTNTFLNLKSDVVNLSAKANYNILYTDTVFYEFVSQYLKADKNDTGFVRKEMPQSLDFKLSINDEKLVASNLIPGLSAINTEEITGGFNLANKKINLDAEVNSLVYSDVVEVDTVNLNIKMEGDKVIYNFLVDNIYAYDFETYKINFTAETSKDSLFFRLLNSKNDTSRINLAMSYRFENDSSAYLKILNPLMIGGRNLKINSENQISFVSNKVFTSRIEIKDSLSRIILYKGNLDSLFHIKAENIDLAMFADMYYKKKAFVSGRLFADIKFNRKGILKAQTGVEKFTINKQNLGTFNMLAENTKDRYILDAYLKQDSVKKLIINGYLPKGTETYIPYLTARFVHLDIRKFEDILSAYFKNFEGYINGTLEISDKNGEFMLQSDLDLDKVKLQSIFRNSNLYIDKQKIKIINNELIFNNLTFKDSAGNSFVVNGKIDNFINDNLYADFSIDVKNYLLLDIPETRNNKLFGKLIIDNVSKINGHRDKLKIISNLRVRKGSQLTYIYDDGTMQNKISSEGIVEFTTQLKDTLTLLDTIRHDWLSAMNLNAKIKIDKETKINFVLNKAAGEGLTVYGGGELALNISNNGMININGLFNVEKGDYKLSYYGLVSREFKIEKGSNIKWVGSLTNPIIDLTAKYKIRASPYPLMVNTTDNKTDLQKYKNAETFFVNLGILGSAQQPKMQFQIEYPQVYENTYYPDVQTRINQINSDESAVNKQAMSLMIIGGFVTDDGVYSNVGNTFVNNSVSGILTSQLNNASNNLLNSGIDFDVDINNRSSYSTQGDVSTATDVKLKMKKYLLNNHVVVEVAGGMTFDDQGKSINPNNKAGLQDVALEYYITQDGKYRIRLFSQRDYSTLSQDEQQNGISFVFTTDFNRINELFKKTSKADE